MGDHGLIYECKVNTDREIFRLTDDDYYSPYMFITKERNIGIGVGGHVFVKPVEEWHRLAMEEGFLQEMEHPYVEDKDPASCASAKWREKAKEHIGKLICRIMVTMRNW